MFLTLRERDKRFQSGTKSPHLVHFAQWQPSFSFLEAILVSNCPKIISFANLKSLAPAEFKLLTNF